MFKIFIKTKLYPCHLMIMCMTKVPSRGVKQTKFIPEDSELQKWSVMVKLLREKRDKFYYLVNEIWNI